MCYINQRFTLKQYQLSNSFQFIYFCNNSQEKGATMFAKALIICTVVAAAAAITPGYLDGALAVGGQSEHTVRGFAGLSSVSKQSKAIHSPYSSSQKTDIRVTNDGFAAPLAYHGGYAHPGYAAPLAHHHAYAAAPAIAHPAYHHGYAAPAYAAPAHIAHHGYAAPAYAAAPAYHHGYAAPALAKSGLGVAYSPAIGTGVAHATFSGYGINYGY